MMRLAHHFILAYYIFANNFIHSRLRQHQVACLLPFSFKMPFFSRNTDHVEAAPPPPPVVEEPPKRHGLFGSRHRSTSPTPSNRTDATHSTRNTSTTYHTSPDREGNNGSIFRRSTDAGSHSGRRSLLHRSFGNGNAAELDPSIVQARERVIGAEAAERDADRALMAARESVRQARDHVKRLELEAEEEARRAKIKQYHAREVSKRGKQLGRKLPSCRHNETRC